MHRLMLRWKVLAPVVGGVLATLYLIQPDGDEATAPVPAPDTALIEQVATPPLTWPGFGATVQPDRNISAASTDNAQARTDVSASATQFNGDAPPPEPAQQAGAEDIMHQALNAADPSVREAAINQLAKISAPDTIYTLGHALQDGDVNNRRAAVNALRELGYNSGDPDGQIRNLLRVASGDPDPGVATWAGEIIEGLNATLEQ